MRRIPSMLAVVLVLAWAAAAPGETKIYKADQFAADIATASAAVSGVPLATQPGWAQGEAFGQIYRPAPADYPVKVLGVQMILAAPPNATTLKAPARIEIWLSDSEAADPGKTEPDFAISTTDLFNPSTGQLGMPLVGNMAYTADFDWSTPEGHPPVVTQGNIRAVVRYTNPAQGMQSEWGTIQCLQLEGLGCGCQNVGVLLDQTSTPNTNLMHIISPLGQCSGANKAWMFMESAGVTGDVILRLKVDVPGGVPVEDVIEDTGATDVGGTDEGPADPGAVDDGTPPDTGAPDTGTPDAGTPDAGTPDAGAPDTGTPDAGTPDPGGADLAADVPAIVDAGTDEAGPKGGGCAAGAPGGAAGVLAAFAAFAAMAWARGRRRRWA